MITYILVGALIAFVLLISYLLFSHMKGNRFGLILKLFLLVFGTASGAFNGCCTGRWWSG